MYCTRVKMCMYLQTHICSIAESGCVARQTPVINMNASTPVQSTQINV